DSRCLRERKSLAQQHVRGGSAGGDAGQSGGEGNGRRTHPRDRRRGPCNRFEVLRDVCALVHSRLWLVLFQHRGGRPGLVGWVGRLASAPRPGVSSSATMSTTFEERRTLHFRSLSLSQTHVLWGTC